MTPDEGAVVKPALTEEDLAALREAVILLEQDTFTEAVLNTVGKFVGGGMSLAGGFVRGSRTSSPRRSIAWS